MHQLTEEQTGIVTAVLEGHDVAVTACAGAGKTSSLIAVAEAYKTRFPDRKVLYLVFNKKNQVESETKFPSNVTVKTFHGLAYGVTGRKFSYRIAKKERHGSMLVSGLLGLNPIEVEYRQYDKPTKKVLNEYTLIGILMDSLRRYAASDATEPDDSYIYWTAAGIHPDDQRNVNKTLKKHLGPYMQDAWNDLTDPNGILAFSSIGHDVYLKLFQLQLQNTSYDLVLADEMQDASMCKRDIVYRSAKQRIIVGDPNQMIYEWNGALNCLDPKLTVGFTHKTLSKSFRFGPRIAQVANSILASLGTLRVIGHDPIDSIINPGTSPEAILCQTNAGVLQSAINEIELGRKPYIQGGVKELESFVLAAQELKTSGSTKHHDLNMFDSWDAVLDAVEHDFLMTDLQLFVSIIEKKGVATVLRALKKVVWREDMGDVTISTIHKSKGLEWDHVRLGSDVQPPKTFWSDPYLRLLYVASTRGKKGLTLSSALTMIDGRVSLAAPLMTTVGGD